MVDVIQNNFNSNLHMDHNNEEVGAGRNIGVQTSRDSHAILVQNNYLTIISSQTITYNEETGRHAGQLVAGTLPERPTPGVQDVNKEKIHWQNLYHFFKNH